MSEKKHRIVPILYDEKGLPTGASFLSPVEDTSRAICVVPPNEVLPVLFIPGIMGSNLKLNTPIKDFNNGKDICWRPDSAIYTAWTFANLDPGERRAILNPDNTAVDDRAEIPDSKLPVFKTTDKATRANWKKEFARRGWGTVMLGSYGEILYALELNLNTIYSENFELDSYWQDSILSVKSKSDGEGKSHGWGDLTGFEALNETDLKEKVGDKYWFPVHAAGYNWLRSNEEAGKDIAKRIKSIISHYQGLGYPCKKVIIVTHSMGGLAARAACHPEMGNAQEMVAGVIHGEQPAVGAAAAYKRMHAGFEAGLNPINAIVARALGWSGKEVTSTLSNAPGGLELLPTKLYPTGWLKVQMGSEVAMELPLADPYAEIYSEQAKWWRLMTSEWIDPSAYNVSPEALGSIWNNYLTRLEIADTFHNKLGAYYHPVTHAHYGADEEQKAWTTITWKSGDASSSKSAEFEHENSLDKFKNKLESASKLKNISNANVLAASIEHENALGKIKINLGEVNVTFHISHPDKPGDGTVPEISGAASASKAEFAARMSGYDHQGSYQDQRVKDVTIYSVARIAKSI